MSLQSALGETLIYLTTAGLGYTQLLIAWAEVSYLLYLLNLAWLTPPSTEHSLPNRNHVKLTIVTQRALKV